MSLRLEGENGKPTPQRRVKRGATVLVAVCLVWNAINTGLLMWIPIQMKAEQSRQIERLDGLTELATQAEEIVRAVEELTNARANVSANPR